jgi:hypothetical protein
MANQQLKRSSLSTSEGRWLPSASAAALPLAHRRYAVPYAAAPHAGALCLVKRHVPAPRDYLAALGPRLRNTLRPSIATPPTAERATLMTVNFAHQP